MRILIFANGDPPSRALAQRLAAVHDFLMATDGAAHKAVALGLSPNIVCGDFDSVAMDTAHAELPDAEFIPTPDQDSADLEKAIALARQRGATRITIIGANGGRIDHTLANCALLLRYHHEILIRLVEDGAETWAMSGAESVPFAMQFAAVPGDTISLLSMDGRARVGITGVKWPLHEHLLPIGTLGISNAAVADTMTVTVRGGTIFVCHLYPAE